MRLTRAIYKIYKIVLISVIHWVSYLIESLFGLVSFFDTGLDSAFHIRKKFTLFQLLSASPKKR